MPKGHIEILPSGSYRAIVYAGTDPVTRRARYLRETCKTEKAAVQALGRLLDQAESHKAPDQSATLSFLLDRYLETADLELNTRSTNKSIIERTIKPSLGYVPIRKLRADMLDTLYRHLKDCSKLCNGKIDVDHRTPRPHACDDRCTPHVCKGASPNTIIRVHAICSAALNLAVRYDWIAANPAAKATRPRPEPSDPEPPTPDEVARLLNDVWAADEEFGLFVWLAATTGARRGELVALREHRFDPQAQEMRVAGNYVVKAGQHQEKAPKNRKPRRFSLDPLTCELIAAHLRRRRAACATVNVEVPKDAFVFSPDPDGERLWNPDTMTHRYERYAAKLDITSSLKELRHYSATQLLSNGVDLRTVAGRLGHSGGGVTTLRYYASFIRPADQRAASILANQIADLRKREHLWELFADLPEAERTAIDSVASVLGRQADLPDDMARAYLAEFTNEDSRTDSTKRRLRMKPLPESPYEKIAADLRIQIADGTITGELPRVADIAAAHNVAFGTAQRALTLLKNDGLITVSRGQRARVAPDEVAPAAADR